MPLTVKATRHFRRAWLHSHRDLGGVVGRIFRAGGRHAEQAWHWSNGTESQVPVCGFCGWPTSIKGEGKSGPGEQGGLKRHIQCSIVCSPRPRCGKLEMLPFFFSGQGIKYLKGQNFSVLERIAGHFSSSLTVLETVAVTGIPFVVFRHGAIHG